MSTKKQFKRDTTQNSDKLHLDQYYTPDDVAQHCIDTATVALFNVRTTFYVLFATRNK